MEEGTSEAVRTVDLELQPGDDPLPVSVSFEGSAPQNDAVMDDSFTQTALIENVPAADDKIMELDCNMAIDKDISKETEQNPRGDGVESIIEQPSRQIGDDKIDDQTTMNVEVVADETAQRDVVLSAGIIHARTEAVPEEVDIQEDGLIKAVLEAFEVRRLVETRPIPVLVKGKEVDLVQLSFQVRACGGYDQVTLWSSISRSLGFGKNGGPLLKLVYAKYLKSIENRRLIANQGVQGLQIVSKKEIEDSGKKELMKNQSKSRAITTTRKAGAEDGTTVDNTGIDNSVVSSTDGSESLIQVLEWMKRLALNPGDPRKGQGARVSRWSEAWAGKCETLAARMREILWKKQEHSVVDLSPLQGQDEGSERKRRGRGRLKGIDKRARRASS